MSAKQDILSIKEMSKQEILSILERAKQMKKKTPSTLLQGKIMASCFFEPSTRTRLSFEAAMKRLGGEVIGFSDAANTAVKKGETLHDSMKVIGLYSDVIVIRHPLEGSARQAAEATSTPVINAGDGVNEHPTQTLLDLFTIEECQGTLDALCVAFVGDLRYGRTVHSLALALRHFNCRLYFVALPSLTMPDEICQQLRKAGTPFSFHESIEEVKDKVDILYMTRLQKERFSPAGATFSYSLKPEQLEGVKSTLKVLHPLPRVDEISPKIDETEHAYYFTQAENGLYVRQALLASLLEGKTC